MSKLTVKSARVKRCIDLIMWCRELALHGPHPVEPLKRFAIAHYQIAQGIEWGETVVPDYEAYAAASIHFIVTSELLKLSVEVDFPEFIEDIPRVDIDWKRLFYLVSKAQQMVVYASHPKRIKRGSRYDPALTQKLTSEICLILLGSVPSKERSHWIETATEIMTGSL